MRKVITHGSLFTGIGGFDLAAEVVGFTNVFQVEKDRGRREWLAVNFPGVKQYGNIKKFDGTIYRGAIDVLSGGFPCQPFSQAGRRVGTKDRRYLWPQMLRTIREVRPAWVVAENVPGLLTMSDGVVFESICLALESEGYAVQTLDIPAAGVNAIHKRHRLWILAHANSAGREERNAAGIANGTGFASLVDQAGGIYSHSDELAQFDLSARSGGETRRTRAGFYSRLAGLPTEPPVRLRDDGVRTRLDRRKWNRIIEAAGDAIVPQVAAKIFKGIRYAEENF